MFKRIIKVARIKSLALRNPSQCHFPPAVPHLGLNMEEYGRIELGVSNTGLYTPVHSSIVHGSGKVETTKIFKD